MNTDFQLEPQADVSVEELLKQSPEIIAIREAWIYPQTETETLEEAFLADEYGDDGAGNTVENRAIAQVFKEQKPEEAKCGETNVATMKDLTNVYNAKGEIELAQTCETLAKQWLLSLHLPKNFNYTGASLMNQTREGLLHSWIRHSDQWASQIKVDNLQILQPIQDLLDTICKSKNAKMAKSVVVEVEKRLQSLSNVQWFQVMLVLFRIQNAIYRFLESHITSGRYLGEAINKSGQMQVFFQVANDQVMVLCPSKQLVQPVEKVADPRPIRSIVTVYFVTEAKYKQMRTTKLFHLPNL